MPPCLTAPSLIVPLVVLQALLKEHASDVPKLSYTGRPIVKWPKRVRAKWNSAPWRRAAGPSLKVKRGMAQVMFPIGSSSAPAALLVPASSSGAASSAQAGNHAHHPSASEACLLHVCAEETQSQVRLCICFLVLLCLSVFLVLVCLCVIILDQVSDLAAKATLIRIAMLQSFQFKTSAHSRKQQLVCWVVLSFQRPT